MKTVCINGNNKRKTICATAATNGECCCCCWWWCFWFSQTFAPCTTDFFLNITYNHRQQQQLLELLQKTRGAKERGRGMSDRSHLFLLLNHMSRIATKTAAEFFGRLTTDIPGMVDPRWGLTIYYQLYINRGTLIIALGEIG